MANIKSIGGNPIVLDASGIAPGAVTPDKLADMGGITAGAALGITGEATDSAAWLQRVSTADGPTTIRSIHGRTLRWNQLVSDSDTSVTVPSGHKYVARIDGTTTLATSDGTAITVTGGTDNVFDLTAMFGAGSEPSTVAKFEAMYPLPYHEYDAGSLLPVQMEGIESTSKNLLDERAIDTTIVVSSGRVVENSSSTRGCTGYIEVWPNTTYTLKNPSALSIGLNCVQFFDASKTYISQILPNMGGTSIPQQFTTPADAAFVRVNVGTASIGSIQLELGSVATAHVPYWLQTRTIPAGTLRGAGTVYDELTETERIVRVGVVDLGTLTWAYNANGYMYASGLTPAAETVATQYVVPNATCVPYEMRGNIYVTNPSVAVDKTASINGGTEVRVRDSAYTDAATFKAAMSGVMLHYALATPTTVEIDPPLNMTYRTAAGGTERVMVPAGEQSAPPAIVAAQGYTAESLRDAALSAIAPVENGKASTNYGIGSYLVHGGQLCKVTTAIATGEAITIGTNVTATTVMAEVIAIIAQ